MTKSKITTIYDRWEMTFLIFHRDFNELGHVYYDPSQASKDRYGRTVVKMFNNKQLKIYQSGDDPLYKLEVIGVALQ